MLDANGLADFAERALADGMVYWMGTCCYACTKALYEQKRAQYPTHYKDNRAAKYAKDIAEGKTCADCIGLIKGAVWSGFGKKTRKYASNGCPDYGADAMMQFCRRKGMPNGKIDTLPEVRGLYLHKPGHCGVYIGGGWAIEAKSFAAGVVKSCVEGRGWESWAQLPFLQYPDTPASKEPEEGPKTAWTGIVKTKTGSGINLWDTPLKTVSVKRVPEGERVAVLSDERSGFVLARYDGVAGYADVQYLYDAAAAENPEPAGDINVFVPHLTRTQADELLAKHAGAYELPPIGVEIRG